MFQPWDSTADFMRSLIFFSIMQREHLYGKPMETISVSKSCGVLSVLSMDQSVVPQDGPIHHPDAPCMEYLPTFTP